MDRIFDQFRLIRYQKKRIDQDYTYYKKILKKVFNLNSSLPIIPLVHCIRMKYLGMLGFIDVFSTVPDKVSKVLEIKRMMVIFGDFRNKMCC